MKTIIITSLLISLAVFSGCDQDEFLEAKYPPEKKWHKLDDMDMAIALPYTYLLTHPWASPWPIYSYYDMMATDMAQYTGLYINATVEEFINRRHRTTSLEGTRPARWMEGVWTPSWPAIQGCNDALWFLGEHPESPGVDLYELFPNDSTNHVEERVPQIKAELLFFRAYSYYNLALSFTPPYNPGGDNSERVLPLRTRPDYNPETSKIGSTEEIWSQIIDDLVKAKSLMPESWNYEEDAPEGRITYHTISGLLARAYFYTGMHDKAAEQCTDIINSGRYSLGAPDSIMNAWTSVRGEKAASEVIWQTVPNEWEDAVLYNFTAINKTYPDAISGGRYDGTPGSWSQSTWVSSILSNSILKKIGWMVDPENGDYTETDLARMDKRYGNTWLRLGEYRNKTSSIKAFIPIFMDQGYSADESKIMAKDSLFNNYETLNPDLDFPHVYLDKYFRSPAGGGATRTPVMRLAEFYLMRAACTYESDNGGAAADVTEVRRRAGLPAMSSVTEADIRREWIIELGGEGLYLPYLIAMRQPIPPGDRVGVAPVNPPYSSWYWLIAVDEIQRNPGYNGYDPNSKKY